MSNGAEKVEEDFKLESRVLDTTVKAVQNVALADATSKQKPSPWTKNMFLVGSIAPSDSIHTKSIALWMFIGSNFQLLHQRV